MFIVGANAESITQLSLSRIAFGNANPLWSFASSLSTTPSVRVHSNGLLDNNGEIIYALLSIGKLDGTVFISLNSTSGQYIGKKHFISNGFNGSRIIQKGNTLFFIVTQTTNDLFKYSIPEDKIIQVKSMAYTGYQRSFLFSPTNDK